MNTDLKIIRNLLNTQIESKEELKSMIGSDGDFNSGYISGINFAIKQDKTMIELVDKLIKINEK